MCVRLCVCAWLCASVCRMPLPVNFALSRSGCLPRCLSLAHSLTHLHSLSRSRLVSLSLVLFRSRAFFIAFIHSFSFYELHLRSPSRSLARSHSLCRAQAGSQASWLSLALALTFVNCPEHPGCAGFLSIQGLSARRKPL